MSYHDIFLETKAKTQEWEIRSLEYFHNLPNRSQYTLIPSRTYATRAGMRYISPRWRKKHPHNKLWCPTAYCFVMNFGENSSWSMPLFNTEYGYLWDRHLEQWWRLQGVTARTRHTTVPKIPSPCDGWTLLSPKKGTVFTNSRDTYVMLSDGAHRATLAENLSRGLRSILAANITIGDRTTPTGYLEFVGITAAR